MEMDFSETVVNLSPDEEKRMIQSVLKKSICSSKDRLFEQELLSNPLDEQGWLNYVEYKINEMHRKHLHLEGQNVNNNDNEKLKKVNDPSVEEKSLLNLTNQMYNDDDTVVIFGLYERSLLNIPGSIKLWKSYLNFRINSLIDEKNNKKPRNIKDIPNSSSKFQVLDKHTINQFTTTNYCFIRSFFLLREEVDLWLMLLEFLLLQINYVPKVTTFIVKIFDEALQTLSILEHNEIWKLYLKFASLIGGEKAVEIWLKYIKFNPDASEQCALTLQKLCPDYPIVPAIILIDLLANNPNYESNQGKSRFELSLMICDLLCLDASKKSKTIQNINDKIQYDKSNFIYGNRINKMNATSIIHSNIDAPIIIRGLISRYRDHVARLWNYLAKYYIIQKDFNNARNIYEEALESLTTIQDFSVLFDAYTHMEEKIVSHNLSLLEKQKVNDNKMVQDEEENEEINEEEEEEEDDENLYNDENDLITEEIVERSLSRLEWILRRRPFLVNEILLKQNPNNIIEWLNKIQLYKNQLPDSKEDKKYEFTKNKILNIFEDIINTISYSVLRKKEILVLWTTYANFYRDTLEEKEEYLNILEKGCYILGKHFDVEALNDLICIQCENYLKDNNIDEALKILIKYTTPPSSIGKQDLSSIRYNNYNIPSYKRIFKSVKLWGLYADLEESKCMNILEERIQLSDKNKENSFIYLTKDELINVKTVYERIIELKIVTVDMILNYSNILYKCGWIEDSFAIYERGISLFGYPLAYEIWNIYIPKMIDFSRKRGITNNDKTKLQRLDLERLRDLFEQALLDCPNDLNITLIIQYSNLEFNYGSSKNGLNILKEGIDKVQDKDKQKIIDLLTTKTYEIHGKEI